MAVRQPLDFLHDIAPIVVGGLVLAILLVLVISTIDRHRRKNDR